MLRLVIFVSILNLVYGLINITSQPAKVRNGDFIKLICAVGTMKNTVEWNYGGVTYFSCDPPYTNCYTNTRITNDGYYDFSINDDSLIVILPVSVNQNDGTWSCYHGNEKADLEIDNADAAGILRFYLTKIDKTTIKCDVKSELPVDVVISVVSYKGEKKIIYDVKQSSLSDHSVETSFQCSDGFVYCNFTNGYGPIVFKSRSVSGYLDCPLKILYEFPYNTNVILDTPTSIENQFIYTYTYKILYYVGWPTPSTSLYRIGADGIPNVSDGNDIGSSYRNPTNTEPASIFIYTSNPETVKTGKYILTLKQENTTEVVHLNIEKSTNDTTKPEDDMDKTTDMDKNIEMETNMMLNLGVAGFVMTLVLVLILVIVGIFWFVRIKRTPSGPVDKNQDYSIPVQTPSNEPDQTYEDLDKL